MNKQQTVIITIGIIITFFAMIFGVIYGHVDYDWEQDKCSNMKSSTYEFNYDVQLGADYASHCYWYQNHPMAYISNIIMGLVMGILISLIPWLIIMGLFMTVYDDF